MPGHKLLAGMFEKLKSLSYKQEGLGAGDICGMKRQD